jgi:hypothetical protein
MHNLLRENYKHPFPVVPIDTDIFKSDEWENLDNKYLKSILNGKWFTLKKHTIGFRDKHKYHTFESMSKLLNS